MRELLTNVCSIQYGYAFDSSLFSENQGLPLVRIRDVVRGFSETYTTEKCSEDYIVYNGDMLIGMDGEFNIAKWNGGNALLNQRVCKLIPSERINAGYLFYFMPSALKAIEAKTPFVTVKHLSARELNKVEVPLPPMQEQQQIAKVLDSVSAIIVARKQQLAKLDELVKSRFVELFDGKGYPEITIGELVASKVNSVKKVFAPTDTIKYIDISSIDNKRNVMTGYTEYVLEEAPSRAQQHIKKGDIVVSTVRPNLKNVAITGYEYDNLVASSGFCVLRAEKCLPAYLMAVVCSNDFTDAMTKVVTGANYPAIKDSDVRNYVVPNPPIEIQEQFAAFVKQTDKSKLAVQQSLEQLEVLKKSLMQKYFG